MAVKSLRDRKFIKLLARLPDHAQYLAEQKFLLWRANPAHPSLDFKELTHDRWSVRVGDHYRAVGIRHGELMIGYWIGTHENYNNLL
ncbi:MAG: hypothetical protein LBK60_07960 [Verrucomicrobiales bacterium]|nr:hypothetical protein [Verrucomicrobiales bacterium]